ncbi:MAG TPA: tyrosine-type recombinase/integrase [Candidatus Brocadiia bacterium]
MHTGLRKSEFEGLAWCDVLDGSIQVRDAKNPLKQRLLPLHPEAMGLLRARNRQAGSLFHLPKSPSSLLRMFKKDLKKAGISSEIDLHCLRVTFVSALARAGGLK